MKTNLLFKNFVSLVPANALLPLIQFLVVPIYIDYLGLEGYGLIGFFAALTLVLSIFSRGVSGVIQREFAIRDVHPVDRITMRKFQFTMEILYWAIGLAVGIIIAGFSSYISEKWIYLETISRDDVRYCVLLIALRIVLALPTGAYSSVLVGLQRHVTISSLNIVYSLVAVATNLFAIFIFRSVLAFYISDLIVLACYTLVLRFCTLRAMPPREVSSHVYFDFEEIKKAWRMILGLIGINGINTLISQIDRLVIANWLPLTLLGVYNAGAAGGSLLKIAVIGPFVSAVFPQTCQLCMSSKLDGFASHVLRNSKIVFILTLACGLPLSLFASEVLEVWTRNSLVVSEGAVVMALYLYGTIASGMAETFTRSQLAQGITRYSVWFNCVLLIWYPPVVWYMVKEFGLVGGAGASVLSAFTCWMYQIVIHHFVLAPHATISQYVRPLLLVGLADFCLALTARHAANVWFMHSPWLALAVAAIASGLSVLIGGAMIFGITPIREQLLNLLSARLWVESGITRK